MSLVRDRLDHGAPAMRAVAWALAALLLASDAQAGGGSENVLLVVNDLSDDSKRIANHYIRWRNLPDSNVLHIRWRGSQANCNVERFRNELLKPILKTIGERGLSKQIDYVVYSAGFPWRVNLQPDFPEEKFPPEMRPIASLTGATYLWQYVLQKSKAIVTPESNWYVPKTPTSNLFRCQSLAGVPSRGFQLEYLWDQTSQRTDKKEAGQRYLLSTMLGVTNGRGNTVDEVLNYLQRSIAADRTQPGGTFYFARNRDVRSQARHTCYKGVAETLRAEGARAKIVQ
ncbi:MAG: hypothetical protein AAGF31_13700, partial [Planctomycetota bacterium]